MTTKGKLAEQILRLLKGGDLGAEIETDEREIFLLIGQVINQLIKAERFLNLNENDRHTSPTFIASYEDVPLAPYQRVCKLTLPAYPVSLPRNMGVWRIAPMTDFNNPFIPMQSGQYAMFQGHVAGILQSKTGYEVQGREVIFTRDLISLGTTEVFVQLIILDIDQYDEFEPLPINTDQEMQVIQQVVQILAPRPESDKVVDNKDYSS
ncbi:MAG TPA: hypothetical protein DCG19_03285 [Cryomorphaceae bacterium]|nr:hypothetical protein [Owenweeksia sp.]HAD96401.1 hypothetical protein [Cryomorphaceae bacterium]|tara:strand:+ start:12701 stop:13324 length:624 start_codon:yes stop_codon:yes gene_type:complete